MKITNKMINPEIRKVGVAIRTLLPFFRVSTFKLLNYFRVFTKGKAGKGIHYEQRFIHRNSGNSNQNEIRLCIYSPLKSKKNVPGILWIHGGGYAFGIPEQDEIFIRRFVLEHGCVVVAPDYCLSTEAPYPAALNDCYTTLLWLKENASAYGIRSDQLMVGGESAGGGLTAALAIYARDKGEVAIAFQMPLYPMLDDRMITESSKNNDAPVWNTKSNENGWKLYLDSLYNTENVPVYAAPARLKDFTNLPPAFTFIGSIDPFYDETVTYFEQLKAVGIPANYQVFKGCFHAFDILAINSTPAIKAWALLEENFRFAVSHYFAKQLQ